MEFANLIVIFVAGWLVLRRPDKERLAFRLLIVSVLLYRDSSVFVVATPVPAPANSHR